MYLNLIFESFKLAISALKGNLLRTILSLLGITIGIFSIIAVLAAVDSMDKKIASDLSMMDSNTMFLKRFNFAPVDDVPRWKINQFPDVTFSEYQFLKKNLNDLKHAAFILFAPRENIKSDLHAVKNIRIEPCTPELIEIEPVEFKRGRFFNHSESDSGKPVIIIGYDVATNLFKNNNPIGKHVRLYGKRFTVIGVLEKQGSSMMGESSDVKAFIPVNFIRNNFGVNTRRFTPAIVLKPNSKVDTEAFKATVTQKLRQKRGLKFDQINNFFIDILEGFKEFIDTIMFRLNLIGWIISAFSLLVGGFGIANIMFVSVKERNNIIGIQKALGAKNRFILMQFLFEAIALSLIGGIIGILLVWIISAVLTLLLNFPFTLSGFNILIGFTTSSLIGFVSGIIPAYSASKLNPVDAIRTGI